MTLCTLVSLFGPHWDEHCNSQDMEMVTDCYRKTVRHNLGQVRPGASVRARREHGTGGVWDRDTLSRPRYVQQCWNEKEHP